MLPRRRQLHVWIAEPDHDFLSDLARSRDESLATLMRRVIRSMRADVGRRNEVMRLSMGSPTVGDLAKRSSQ